LTASRAGPTPEYNIWGFSGLIALAELPFGNLKAAQWMAQHYFEHNIEFIQGQPNF